ncbi:MAG TPA: Bcr/CflA family drug resistance efflux transporter [Sphingobacteriaceae bacterium]|nr:Bcr/CflA family drug resistance efflux transporter [Sphingobacteriaceae bacterium]
MTKKRYYFLVLILGSLTALSPFSIDMYLPGFQVIATDLHTTAARVSLSLSSYFMGLAGGQLLYGPLLDRFGRKKPLYAGLILYCLASAGCMLSTSIDQLIYIRFIQAIGGCAAGVASVAMVRDLFPVKDIPKVFSLLILVLSASPLIAPTAGGYVINTFGWQAVLIILLLIGVLNLFASIFFLPESYAADPTISLKPKSIIKNFIVVLREPAFYTYSLTGAVAFSGLFVYVSGAPIVFMDIFKVTAQTFGWIFAGISLGFIGSSQVNTLMLRKFTSEQLVLAALINQFIIGLVFLTGTVNGWFGLPAILVCIFLFLCCIGFTNPNASALCLAPFTKNAGSASALMGALQMGIGASISALVGLFDVKSAVPMVAIMAGTSLLALLILLAGRKAIRKSGSNVKIADKGFETIQMH